MKKKTANITQHLSCCRASWKSRYSVNLKRRKYEMGRLTSCLYFSLSCTSVSRTSKSLAVFKGKQACRFSAIVSGSCLCRTGGISASWASIDVSRPSIVTTFSITFSVVRCVCSQVTVNCFSTLYVEHG